MERSDLGLDHAAHRKRSSTRGARVVVAGGKALAEINRGSSMAIGPFWVFWIRWVIPAAIIVILVSGWWPQ